MKIETKRRRLPANNAGAERACSTLMRERDYYLEAKLNRIKQLLR
jgi:hypothetical protein